MITQLFTRVAGAALILAMAIAPATALAASTFYGTVSHVSMNNIKVTDTHTNQTLSFEILPKFDQIFSADGKTTYQMKRIHAGSYVCIIYDQKMIGSRHADRIYVMNNANDRIKTL
jgi:hypothetical protein